MDKNSQEWAELEDLAGRIRDLHSNRARTAIGGGALTAIKIEECEVQRQRLINRLSEHLANSIVDSLALPA